MRGEPDNRGEMGSDSPGLRLLDSARSLVATGWCQGADARDREGEEVDPWDERAASWSILGALVATLEQEAESTGELPLHELAAALYAIADVIETHSLAAWNDAPERTQAEVVKTLAAAETRYVSPWAGHLPSLN